MFTSILIWNCVLSLNFLHIYCLQLFVAAYHLQKGKERYHVHLSSIIKHLESLKLILFSNLKGSYHATGLVVSSKLPRFSDMYSLTIESADPKSISANKPVELTKSVTKWFT